MHIDFQNSLLREFAIRKSLRRFRNFCLFSGFLSKNKNKSVTKIYHSTLWLNKYRI